MDDLRVIVEIHDNKLFFIFKLDWVFWLNFCLQKSNNYFIYVLLPFNLTFFYVIKFLLALFLLIFIRAGLPRYRYDYLTKLGWTKFLLLVLSLLIIYYCCLFLW
jgi:NADH:ubiquinone oxidoreductase subunit H